MDTIYIEEEIENHPRAQKLLQKLQPKRVISCERYSEIFNRKNQSFRLQKKRPRLILAKKHTHFLHPIPKNHGIGGARNFYFSHLLNCPYDCSYCFLQGMYRSSHFVFFINFEDFQKEIAEKAESETYFFSGYDADSLAFDSVTRFTEEFYPFFQNRPKAILELRTKSCHIKPLLNKPPLENWIIAYTLNPEKIAKSYEIKAPSLEKRLKAIKELQNKGWQIGLRFDPIIYTSDFETLYIQFFEQVFQSMNLDLIHSITLGVIRLPKTTYQTMTQQGSDKKLLATIDNAGSNLYTYDTSIRKQIAAFCKKMIEKYIPKYKLFIMDEL